MLLLHDAGQVVANKPCTTVPGPTHLSMGVCRVSGLQPVHLLGMDGVYGTGLATGLGHGHELRHVMLHQLMDHGRILCDHIAGHAITRLLLDVISPGAPYFANDDGTHAGDHRGQRGCEEYGRHPSILLSTCAWTRPTHSIWRSRIRGPSKFCYVTTWPLARRQRGRRKAEECMPL